MIRALPVLLCVAFLPSADLAGAERPSWNARAAAQYLDSRSDWWSGWAPTVRDKDTFCVSCHTSLPYALGRPALRAALSEKAPTGAEQKLIENVRARVRRWSEVQPFYKNVASAPHRGDESRSSEAILSALILTSYDRPRGALSDESRLALDHMLELLQPAGEPGAPWRWMDFGYQPWEAKDSQFWGMTLAAAALGNTPAAWRTSTPAEQALARLKTWFVQEEASQPVFNRMWLLWADARLPGILTAGRKKAIIQEIVGKQRPDGGWSSASLLAADWKRKDASPADPESDGYATALGAWVLQEAGVKASDRPVQSALSWLGKHQDSATGQLPAMSLNKQRDPASDIGRFMSDAATALAALAFEFRPGV